MMVTKCSVRKLFLAAALIAAIALAFVGAAVQANAADTETAQTQAASVGITPYEKMTLAQDNGNGEWELKNGGDCGFFVNHELEDSGMISFRLRFGDGCTYQSGDRYLFAKVNPGGAGDGLFGIRTDGKVHGVSANSDSGNNIINNTPFIYPFEYVKAREVGAGSLEYDFAYYRKGDEVYLLTKYASASAYIVSAKHPCAQNIPNLNFYNTGDGDKHMIVSNVTYTADATAFYEKALLNGKLTNGPSIKEDNGTYSAKILGSNAIAGGGKYGALVGDGVHYKEDGKYTIRAKAEGEVGQWMMYGFYMMTADGKIAHFGAFGTDGGFFANAFEMSLSESDGYTYRIAVNSERNDAGIIDKLTETSFSWGIGAQATLYMQAVIDNDTVEYYVSNEGFDSLTKVIKVNLRTFFENATVPQTGITWEQGNDNGAAAKERFPAETGLMKVGVYKFGDGGKAAAFSDISVDYEGYHNDKTTVSATEATCTQEGNTEHQTCDICGELFDMQGEVISPEDTVVAKKPHDLTKTDEKAATCTEDGNAEYYTCSVCHKHFADEECETELTEDELTVPAGHEISKVSAVAPTHTATGNTEYYACSECGKCFSDEQGETEIEESSTVLPKTPHAMRKLDAQQATCAQGGNTEYYVCSECGKYYADENGEHEIELKDTVTAPAEHTLTKTEATEATESKEGNIEYYTCSECGKIFSDAKGANEITLAQTVIPKKASADSGCGSIAGGGNVLALSAMCFVLVTASLIILKRRKRDNG